MFHFPHNFNKSQKSFKLKSKNSLLEFTAMSKKKRRKKMYQNVGHHRKWQRPLIDSATATQAVFDDIFLLVLNNRPPIKKASQKLITFLFFFIFCHSLALFLSLPIRLLLLIWLHKLLIEFFLRSRNLAYTVAMLSSDEEV